MKRQIRLAAGWLVVCVALVAAAPVGAQLGSRSTEEWIAALDAPARVKSLRIPEVIAALRLQPGHVVADIGAGTGLFTLPLARAVRPAGTVYAVEVDESLLEHLVEAAEEQGVTNVRPVLGEFDDPLLAQPVDLAFIHDVLHHIENRDAYLESLVRSVKPSGRIAIVDFLKGHGHRDDAAMQIGKDEATAMMATVGFKPVEDIPLFDDKYYVVYAR